MVHPRYSEYSLEVMEMSKRKLDNAVYAKALAAAPKSTAHGQLAAANQRTGGVNGYAD